MSSYYGLDIFGWIGAIGGILTFLLIFWKCAQWKGGLDQWRGTIDIWKDTSDTQSAKLSEEIRNLSVDVKVILTNLERESTRNGMVHHESPLVASEEAIAVLDRVSLTAEIDNSYYKILRKVNEKAKLSIYKNIKSDERFVELTPSIVHEMIDEEKIKKSKIKEALQELEKIFGVEAASYYGILLLITAYILEKRRDEGFIDDISKIYKNIEAISCKNPQEILEAFNGDIDSALESYEHTVREAKNLNLETRVESQLRLGSLYFLKGTLDKAIDEMQDALNFLQKQTEKNPEFISMVLSEMAYVYYKKGDYDKSIEISNEAISSDDEIFLSYLARGNSYLELKKENEAIKDLTKAIELSPEIGSLYFSRALCYNELEDYDKAIEDYDKAIELDPDDKGCYYNRGINLMNNGEEEKALEAFSTLIQKFPEYPLAYLGRAHVYGHLGDYNQKLKDYEKALTLDPDNVQKFIIYHSIGITNKSLAQYDQALENIEKSLRIAEDLPDKDSLIASVLLDLGKVHGEIGNNKEAIETTNQALKLFRKLRDTEGIELATKQLEMVEESIS